MMPPKNERESQNQTRQQQQVNQYQLIYSDDDEDFEPAPKTQLKLCTSARLKLQKSQSQSKQSQPIDQSQKQPQLPIFPESLAEFNSLLPDNLKSASFVLVSQSNLVEMDLNKIVFRPTEQFYPQKLREFASSISQNAPVYIVCVGLLTDNVELVERIEAELKIFGHENVKTGGSNVCCFARVARFVQMQQTQSDIVKELLRTQDFSGSQIFADLQQMRKLLGEALRIGSLEDCKPTNPLLNLLSFVFHQQLKVDPVQYFRCPNFRFANLSPLQQFVLKTADFLLKQQLSPKSFTRRFKRYYTGFSRSNSVVYEISRVLSKKLAQQLYFLLLENMIKYGHALPEVRQNYFYSDYGELQMQSKHRVVGLRALNPENVELLVFDKELMAHARLIVQFSLKYWKNISRSRRFLVRKLLRQDDTAEILLKNDLNITEAEAAAHVKSMVAQSSTKSLDLFWERAEQQFV